MDRSYQKLFVRIIYLTIYFIRKINKKLKLHIQEISYILNKLIILKESQ